VLKSKNPHIDSSGGTYILLSGGFACWFVLRDAFGSDAMLEKLGAEGSTLVGGNRGECFQYR
jgi:hypothetical protein